MQITMRATESLKNYDNNARTHSDAQIDEIINSIKNYGFLDPIEIGDDLVVISGHARLAAAVKLGLGQVPTISHSHLNKSHRKGYILAANKIAMKAGWDFGLLKEEFTDLIEDEFDTALTGFTEEEIKDIMNPEILNDGLVDEDDCEGGEGGDTRTQRGDVWLLGTHRLKCGDSIDPNHVADLIGSHTIDMAFNDPPYGIDERTDRVKAKRSHKVKAGKYEKIQGDTSTQTAIDAYNLCESLNIPVMVFWGGNYYCHALPETANWCVWDKREEEKHRDSNSDCELAWVKSRFSSVRIFRHLWKGMFKGSEKKDARMHPTQKPVALAEWCFNEYAPKAKVILDLFGGSGTTLIACEKLGRKCVMMELDEKYCDVIVKRWQKFTGKLATLESTGEEFNGRQA